MINYLLEKKRSIGKIEKKSIARIQEYQEALEKDNGDSLLNWQSRMITECLMLITKVQTRCEVNKRVLLFSEAMESARLYPHDPTLLIEHIMQEYPTIKDKQKVTLSSNYVYKSHPMSVQVDLPHFQKVNLRLKDWPKLDQKLLVSTD